MDKELVTAMVSIGALGIGAQWLAWRLRLPSIVLLMLAGLLAGPVAGVIDPSRDFDGLLYPFIALSVAIILFEGGLNLRWHEYREAGIDVIRLVTAGLLLSGILGSVAAHYIGGLSWPVALLFGTISVVTGPTVILPMLKQARLRRRPAALLKWEGIINDPLGALLTVLVFEYFSASQHALAVGDVFVNLGVALAVALASGVACAYLLKRIFYRGQVPEYLKAPVLLAAILVLYVLMNAVQEEAGLLAVTIAGFALANFRLRNIEELQRFSRYLTLLLVSGIFILLSADIKMDVLMRLDWSSAALIAAIVFIVRPVAVYVSTLGTGIDWRERVLTGWIAPRGIVAAAVAGIIGPRMVEASYPGADQLLPLVFALIMATVLLHGLSIGWLARRLDLASDRTNGLLIVGASPWSVDLAQAFQELEVPTVVSDSSWNHLYNARMKGVRVHHDHILSERSDDTLELHELSYLLSATANDAYNALVCTHFAPEFGRNRVYQLPSQENGDGDLRMMARSMRGRIAFDRKFHYDGFMRCHYAGWKFRWSRVDAEDGGENLPAAPGKGAVPLVLVREKGEILFYPLDDDEAPRPGDRVISYHPPGG
ncbi:MAG: cation:proton antiporter [Gammaproteobacteria bacterium]